jgi:chromosome segregation ATPase
MRLPTSGEPPAPTGGDVASTVRRDRRFLVPIVLCVVALCGAGWATYLARENGNAATEWRHRAVDYEEQVNGLRTLIGERSAQLNDRTREANSLVSNLRSTRAKLRRSEGDVSSLSHRQRQLANEKAQLEDERHLLEQQASMLVDVASRYIDCKSSLIDVINALVYDNYSDASYEFGRAKSDCDSASSALNSYVNAYP